MQLPKPLTTHNQDFDRLTQSISWELHTLRQIHTLSEQGIAHDSNCRDAGRMAAEIHRLATEAEQVAPTAEANTWLNRATYVAALMETEIKREQAA